MDHRHSPNSYKPSKMRCVFQSVMMAFLVATCCSSYIPQAEQSEPEIPPTIEIRVHEIDDDLYPVAFIKNIVTHLTKEKLQIVNGEKMKNILDERSGKSGNCSIISTGTKRHIYQARNEYGDVYTVVNDLVEGGLIFEICRNPFSACESDRKAASSSEHSCCIPKSTNYDLEVLRQPNLQMKKDSNSQYAIPYYKDSNVKYTSNETITLNLSVSNTACVCEAQISKP